MERWRKRRSLCAEAEAGPLFPDRAALVPSADGLTHFQAVEGEGVLGDELVVGCGVVVFDDEAHQRQLWHVHVELEVFVPGRVETSKR